MGEYHSNIATQASPNQRNKNVAFGNKKRRDGNITAAASQNRIKKKFKKEVVRENLYVG